MSRKDRKQWSLGVLCVFLSMFFWLSGFGSCEQEQPPQLTVRSVQDLGLLATSSTIRGRDGGYSGVFAAHSVWLYGDTVLEKPGADGSSWRNNSMSCSEDLDSTDGIGGFQERVDSLGAPMEFFPQTETEKAFNQAHQGENCQEKPCGARWALWPGAIVSDIDRDRALIFYHEIYAEPGDFNFERVGSSLAVWKDFDDSPERPVFWEGAEHPTLMFEKEEPGFGSAALVEGDMLYVYACQLEGWDKPCRLARVPLSDALDRTAWRFFAGENKWVVELGLAKSVFDGNDMMTVAYNRYLKAFVAVYSQPMDRKVMLRTAPRPEGPWTGALPLFEAMEPESDNGWIYDALSHPEYDQEEGRIFMVSYSRTTGFLQGEVRLVRVELQ